VKVGEQRIHNFEAVWRMNENPCASAAWNDFPVMMCGDAFQHTNTRRADGNNAATFTFCRVHDASGCVTYFKSFLVHDVVFQCCRFHWCESAETDVQRHETNLHAASAQFIK